jgi:vacuolar-type H+-ATPase subunit E/Vma4
MKSKGAPTLQNLDVDMARAFDRLDYLERYLQHIESWIKRADDKIGQITSDLEALARRQR